MLNSRPGPAPRSFADERDEARLSMGGLARTIDVIVPTFKEVGNIALLIERLDELNARPAQLQLTIVDDDSRDGTAETVERLRSSLGQADRPHRPIGV